MHREAHQSSGGRMRQLEIDVSMVCTLTVDLPAPLHPLLHADEIPSNNNNIYVHFHAANSIQYQHVHHHY